MQGSPTAASSRLGSRWLKKTPSQLTNCSVGGACLCWGPVVVVWLVHIITTMIWRWWWECRSRNGCVSWGYYLYNDDIGTPCISVALPHFYSPSTALVLQSQLRSEVHKPMESCHPLLAVEPSSPLRPKCKDNGSSQPCRFAPAPSARSLRDRYVHGNGTRKGSLELPSCGWIRLSPFAA